jgi:hypothetical protein
MGNTEGGRLNGFIHKQVYFSGVPSVLQPCPPRTTLSTEITPPESSRYTANPFTETVEGQVNPRTTYQAGVSQEQLQALFTQISLKNNFSSQTELLYNRACPGYTPPFSSVIPPIPVCPPLPPPPALPYIPGTNPTKCTNSIF